MIYYDEAGDYVVPNVFSPKGLVSRPDNMGETVLHTRRPFISKRTMTSFFKDLLRNCLADQKA